MMRSLAHLINKALEILCISILALMSILVFLNVVLRYGFNSGISITEEISRYLFIWLAFLGAVLAFNENQHVSVTVLVNKLPPFGQAILKFITDMMMLICCYLIIAGSWIQFQLNLNNFAPISGLPQGLTYFASVIAGILVSALLITRLISTIFFIFRGEVK